MSILGEDLDGVAVAIRAEFGLSGFLVECFLEFFILVRIVSLVSVQMADSDNCLNISQLHTDPLRYPYDAPASIYISCCMRSVHLLIT